MDYQNLPGISRIQAVPIEMLPDNIQAKALAGVRITLLSDAQEIAFNNSSLSYERNFSSNGYAESVVLKFRSHVDLTKYKYAFVVTDVNKHRYLLGFKEYPSLRIERTKVVSTSAVNIYDYQISLTAKKALIEL